MIGDSYDKLRDASSETEYNSIIIGGKIVVIALRMTVHAGDLKQHISMWAINAFQYWWKGT